MYVGARRTSALCTALRTANRARAQIVATDWTHVLCVFWRRLRQERVNYSGVCKQESVLHHRVNERHDQCWSETLSASGDRLCNGNRKGPREHIQHDSDGHHYHER